MSAATWKCANCGAVSADSCIANGCAMCEREAPVAPIVEGAALDADEFLPCPFCASEKPEVYHDTNSDHRYDWDFHVECTECGGAGEHDKNREEAIAAWNRRAALAAPAPVQPAPGVPHDQLGATPRSDREAALIDLQYDAGARAGFMAGASGDDSFIAKLDQRVAGAVGIVKGDAS